jgi:thiosulfate/3-mercaptopyruvate sulfurtransferase
MRLPGLLASPAWLRAELGSPGLVVADVRWYPDGSGRQRYEAGHVPGAVFLDVDRDLAEPPSGDRGRHPLPAPDEFARTLARSGIGHEDAVVAYDDVHGSVAARLWWMLDAIGHPCAVLDGGLEAWDGPVEAGPADRAPARFTPRPWPRAWYVDTPQVLDLLEHDGALLVDARAHDRFVGDVEPIDARAGHIPGAVNVPWADNLDASTGRFRPPEELLRRYESEGVRSGGDAVAYCGSGVTAASDVLAMRLAGLGRPRLYEGSWSGWIADADRPIATGERGL